ncbi:protein of unknown function (plasmid) [Cupriavidus neocaledonicus]|uniref:Uncharacterized protein n=1 Tax=Cupriavidus neocaledonicus TaxID=1040979 RepID=A0A375HMD3_9BURK|nr:protein of unknown function [Cupriavidus neocaledonicus]
MINKMPKRIKQRRDPSFTFSAAMTSDFCGTVPARGHAAAVRATNAVPRAVIATAGSLQPRKLDRARG